MRLNVCDAENGLTRGGENHDISGGISYVAQMTIAWLCVVSSTYKVVFAGISGLQARPFVPECYVREHPRTSVTDLCTMMSIGENRGRLACIRPTHVSNEECIQTGL